MNKNGAIAAWLVGGGLAVIALACAAASLWNGNMGLAIASMSFSLSVLPFAGLAGLASIVFDDAS